ncbi:MAG: FG-GAP-like repeat-containing protein [candidate division KSB1 bacterium]|nr:FG-GAP-like repeat-containing protein [candidate division KSB1 bacterium]MDZ7301037.1 FG-GAP-like repeat-containing protein [candidate division KSB1 bacterium]MDZ7312967.1 FG-GAP-like repeat-containing protein [candidate division KSB1 bacterium]
MTQLLRIGCGILFSLPSVLSAQFAFYDSLNGIYWAQIEPPSFEDLEQCQIVHEGLGYVLAATGTLYEFDTTRREPWRPLPRPEGPHDIEKFFALAKDNIWASVNAPALYKRTVFHWDGKNWSPIASPNVYNIRSFLFASAEDGWFAGDYGELWRYRRGQWEQEALPLFIHVNYLASTADSALYVVCEAPEQEAVLQRRQGMWQVFTTNNFPGPLAIALSSWRHLLWANIEYSPKRVEIFNQPVWLLPFKKMEFLPAGAGYGFSGKKIYALKDTAYYEMAEAPVTLSDVAVFDKKFSWIIGANGFMLAPQQSPLAVQTSTDRFFGFREYGMTNLYGMGVLQNRPGTAFRLYFVKTANANSVCEAQSFLHSLNWSDHAANLNLAGPAVYDDLKLSNGASPINYDQAVATGDLNGDGLDDIIVTGMYGHPFVYLNSGHDYYYDATAYSGLKRWGDIRQRPMLANLFDADRDGDLDLFIACQYQSNAFFINNGRGKFTEATEATGLATEGGGIGGYVADFDGDGWEDLYVTRVNRPNLLFRNLGPDSLTGFPRFADASAESGAACWQALKQSQGAAIADYDNDGDFDLFVCNLATGNRLLQNDGKGYFTDATARAGLAGDDQSVGATFFDADNDSDLDLIVANKGFERLYKNQGDGRFAEQSSHLNLGGVFSDAMLNTSRQFGGNSSGTLVHDLDGDEDLDVMVSNYDVGLFVFTNGLNTSNSAIQIFPEGIVSNRSAVGAKIFLYESGKIGDPASLVGLRMIESANSYGCSPAKAAHFGVEPAKMYDVKVVFPSGIVRTVLGMRGGERQVVFEIEGLVASVIKARRALANLLAGYRSRERYAALLLGLLLIGLTLIAGKKFLGVSSYDQKIAAVLFSTSLLICLILWFAPGQREFVLRPLAVSLVAAWLAIFFLRGRRLYQGRAASMEMLQMRLNAFGHGTLVHQLINRFVLYAENFELDGELPAAARIKFAEVIAGLLHFLQNEIRAILSYQYGNNFAMDLAFRLEASWAKLKKALAHLRRSLQTGEKFEPTRLTEIATLQQQLREHVTTIKKRLSEQYYVDVNAVIVELLRQGDYPGVRFIPSPKQPRARITDADLSYVLDELVQNALRHIDEQPAQIDITVHHAYDELHIDVHDNGSGIPQNLWEEIFRFGFTTRLGGKGGFGLYHARQRLEKYGGKIFVVGSKIGKGTTMRICLKADL